MAWLSDGCRVYLGASYSEEKKNVTVYVGGEVSSVTPFKRTVTQERAEWRALTQSAAAAKTPTAGWRIVSRDRKDETNQFVVVEEMITYGDWEADT